MLRYKKWEMARRLKKTIAIIKFIEPYSREKLVSMEFILPEESEKLKKMIDDFG